MNIRLYHANILAMASGFDLIEDGEIWIHDSEILFVGTAEEAKRNYGMVLNLLDDDDWDREIDLKGDVVMPGFKDAHTHSAMTFLRSAADDMPLADWLTKQVFPREALLTEDDVYIATKLAILEYLTSGITTICEMYLHPNTIAKATEDCGFRCVQCGGMNNFSQSIEEQREWFGSLNNGDPLTSFRLGLHAEYTNSRELMEKTAELSHELQAPVYLHCSETENEVAACKERYGLTPTEFLDSIGLLDYGSTFFHGVHVTDHDIEIMKEHKVAVVTNPASNVKLASGIAPISKYIKAGITLGIGTDGPASNNCLDMFREMFLVTGLAKLLEKDASAVDALQVLDMAVKGGAHAIGLSDCDCLAKGKKADLIVIDMKQPNMQPVNNLAKNIVYSGSKSNVRLTMVNGRVLYEDGKFFIGEDPEYIYGAVQKIIDRMR
ncbi:MAG: amidohydrolase [Lachnospiraceae bacterium]|nr:amidohydrolase [Lachnospiraceae bacterium]